jgi:tRNA(Ile2) C34 agmatinyltransferase TiaS
MTKFSVETLAEALYEGFPNLHNLAESMARQYGKAGALSFYHLMDKETQFFWKDIAKQIIEHSKEWEENEGSCCVLSKKETARLTKLQFYRKSLAEQREEEEEKT